MGVILDYDFVRESPNYCVKGGIALALAAAFGVNAPVVNAASIASV